MPVAPVSLTEAGHLTGAAQRRPLSHGVTNRQDGLWLPLHGAIRKKRTYAKGSAFMAFQLEDCSRIGVSGALAVGFAALTASTAFGNVDAWARERPQTDFSRHSIDYGDILSSGPRKDGFHRSMTRNSSHSATPIVSHRLNR